MSVSFNANSLDSVQYNGADLNFLKLNGTTIWERYPAGTVVFSFNIPGTYQFVMPVAGYYRIQIVGGGSNGTSSANGRAGGYLSVTGRFYTYGRHTLTVGGCGDGTGGDTSFVNGLATADTIIAGGGGRGNTFRVLYTTEVNIPSGSGQVSNYDGSSTGPGAGGLINANGQSGLAIITKI